METRVESISPILTVDDVSTALGFYQEVLGFDLAWSWGEPPGMAAVCRDGVEIMLSQRTDARTMGASQVYIAVSGIDAYYAGLQSGGVDIIVPIGDRPYGMRDFRIGDPSGNEISFGQAQSGGA
jgi:uncharacterized glyoxalase superfamily protein PhnB